MDPQFLTLVTIDHEQFGQVEEAVGIIGGRININFAIDAAGATKAAYDNIVRTIMY